ncbi:DOMON domain-containing protein [Candidatus Methanocrinis natronophilus]|uniref:DOMON domain-containing protein n=1 Tax=Candidatus Methanocrinis natronophilus TaxID=3033396 RepID=A0ABT5X4G4_9EURY|nr:DOMON domain-containing protein [Candidatus Methanocrinis natronophilus]MDF0589579.1 DOMON domain-containing protein [Candidatus Methanocrinis natronophilus]
MASKFVLLSLVVLAVLSSGCTGPREDGAGPSREAVEMAVTAEWAPDGVISEGEYARKISLSGGIFEVFWKNDAETLYMAIKGETGGWVSIGFDPSVWMRDADIVIGYVDDEGEVYARDAYSTGNYGPHPPDTDLGGTDDLLEYGGSEKDGFTVIEFKRKMETGDEFDRALRSGETVNIIWGISYSDDPERRHQRAGKGKVTFM